MQQGCNADMGIPLRTEEELRGNTVISPDDVLGLQKITKSKSPASEIGTMERVVKAAQLDEISATHLLLLPCSLCLSLSYLMLNMLPVFMHSLLALSKNYTMDSDSLKEAHCVFEP